LHIVVVHTIFATTKLFSMTYSEKNHEAFLNIFKIWETELANLTEEQLKKQETADSWTLGQVYVHLINATCNFHLNQVKLCLNSSDNKNQKKNFKGFLAYTLLNGFPPIKIKVPPTETYTPKVPQSKQELIEGFEKVKQDMKTSLNGMAANKGGKTAHPGFSFLNAEEWYKIIEMHWRHHLRQKENILKN
jgi:hypothetical protein